MTAQPRDFSPGPMALRIGHAAIRALHAEVMLAPKPGLVSPLDNGAHRDMTLQTFFRSLQALRGYFPAIAAAGAGHAEFDRLRDLGISAEARMLAATSGVNTHRGAIFSLGLLAAAAAQTPQAGAAMICHRVGTAWGCEILRGRPATPASHGSRALHRHGGMGARDQAAAGFPILRDLALPCLHQALHAGLTDQAARVQVLFALMAELDDTNVLHRGGAKGLSFLRATAAGFLEAGGTYRTGWQAVALEVHHACVVRNLSPGGAADLLACTIFLHDIAGGR